MAGFFNLPSSRATTKKDQQLLKKVSSPVKSSTAVTLKGSTKLIDRINAITSLVKSKFAGKEDELELITTEEHLISYIDKCIENNVISIDTETTGLDPILDNIVGICIYTPGLKAAYIPVNHISYITELKCSNQLEIPFLTEQFQRLVDKNVKTIWFNAPFDIRFLGNHINVWFTAYFDTSIAAMCLNSDEPDGSRTLKALHKKYCWGDRGEALTFGKLFDNLPFNLIPIDVAYLYAASDAIYTYELYEFQAQYLEPDGKYYESHDMKDLSNVFFNIEMKSMPTFISMEQTGVSIDFDHAKKIYDKYHELSDKMQHNLEKVCEPYIDLFDDYRRKHPMCKLTDPINYDSPTQLAIIFYDILGLKSPDPKNPRGTGADILEHMEHPIAKAVSDNRSFNKVLSAFIDILPEQARKYPDKRIHCSFKQYGASTGRVSCKNPNLQQIPSNPFVLSDGTKIDSGHDVRQLFTASPGCILMSCDYSGQEVRVTAHLSQDEKLIQAYRDGKDPYCEIASLAYNVPYEECTEYRADGKFNPDGKKRRGEAKRIVLGILYGRGIPSIAEQLGKTVQEAQKIYDSVLAKFEGLAHFIEESEDMARKQGFTETLWGRRRQLKDMQLPYYEFGYKNGFAPDFDPLLDDSSDISTEVPIETVKILTDKLLNCRSFKKREELKEKIRQRGYTIKDNSAYIKRAQRQCVNCVDFETEILTTSGWKKYDDVSVGDEILSFNIDSCEITKDTIKDIHIYEGDFEVYRFKNQSFEAVSTPDHRWVSSTHDTRPKFTTTEKIASTKNNPTYPILKMWDNNFSENTDFTDSQLRVISYLMTDGYFSDTDRPYRAQLVQSESTEKNRRVYSDMIKSLNECGIKFSDTLRFNNCHYLYLYQCDFTEFIRNTFNEHMLTYDFISSLSERQAKIMVDCFVDCDGHTDKRCKSCSRVTFGTKQKADVFQYLCTVAGYASNLYSRDCVGEKHYGNVSNDCGYIEVKNIHYIVSILNRKRSHIYKKHIDKLNVSGVWCVSTGNETWIARHNGCVFITGNSRVQGSAADLTKLAQIELYNNEELRSLGFRMLIPVHDEIIAECPIENVRRCSELMSKCMLDAGRNLCVPLSCDVALFKSWYGEELSVDDF